MTTARQLREKISVLAERMLFGTASETYRTCGKDSCVCHKDKSRRHGPYLHVSYRADGKTRSYNVDAARRDDVLEGTRAWARLQEIARELAERNRAALMDDNARSRSKGKR